MNSKNPLIVRTEPQPANSIAYRMGDMRIWLDHHKVELAAFRPITLDAMVAFDAEFLDARQAALFRAAFGSSARR